MADPVDLQTRYWTYRPAEHEALLAAGWSVLSWPQRLRLHHLECLALLEREPLRAVFEREDVGLLESDDVPSTLMPLLAPDSPFRPRGVVVWQGRDDPYVNKLGLNPSITHGGSLEVLRLDESGQPERLDFVAFADLAVVQFASPALFRAARLTYEDGRPDEIVWLPTLYGPSWRTSNEALRTGAMTLFLPCGETQGLGLGQQDIQVGPHMVGLTNLNRLEFIPA